MLGNRGRARIAGGGGKDILQARIGAREELPDHFAGEHDHRAVRQGEKDLAVGYCDVRALEVEGEAQDHVRTESDFDVLARRRRGNDERQALLRECGDLAGGVGALHAEHIARGFRTRMSALQRLCSMFSTNGAYSL